MTRTKHRGTETQRKPIGLVKKTPAEWQRSNLAVLFFSVSLCLGGGILESEAIMTDRQKLIDRQARLEAVHDQMRKRVAHIPGIVDVGIGLKNVAGQWTDQISFQVFVTKKRPPSQVSAEELIPRE